MATPWLGPHSGVAVATLRKLDSPTVDHFIQICLLDVPCNWVSDAGGQALEHPWVEEGTSEETRTLNERLLQELAPTCLQSVEEIERLVTLATRAADWLQHGSSFGPA